MSQPFVTAAPDHAAAGTAGAYENERFLQAIFDGIQDGICVLDCDLNVVRVNHAMERWYEHVQPLVGRKCYEAYHLRDEPCQVCPTRQALQLRSPQMAEVPLVGPDGVRGRLELYAFPMYDEAGAIVGAIEYVRDVSKRKAAEQARRESEELLRMVMDNIPEAIFWKDRNLVYRGCNRRFVEDGGYSSPADVVGKTALDMPWGQHAWFYHGDDREVMDQDTPKLNIEEPLLKADRSQRWLRANKIPMHDAEGRVVGLLTTYEDVTERKHMEQYMLHTERLAAMGRLAAALAHEVNNPLHGIGNGLELVLNFPLPPEEQREYLHAALHEIERLQELTRRMLDFARPPAFTREPVRLAEALQHALALCGKQLADSQIEVSIDLAAGLPDALASRDHLTQVFLNLIINAAEAMPEGGTLQIAAQRAGEYVAVTFADTGAGIPPDTLSMIFEPFYTTKDASTGLGLAVSHNIVREHGGTITAQNTAHGALFKVTLPIAAAPPWPGTAEAG